MGHARINSHWWSYFDFSLKAKELFQETFDLKKEPTVEENSELYFEIRSKRFEYGIQTIVFAAMTMESLINDYAAIKFGDSFFSQHIDKLDTLSKYLVTTRMVTQKSFPKDEQAYEYLKFLFKIRNKLVHAKSKAMPFKNGEVDSEMLKKMLPDYLSNWEETVNKCFNTMKICSDALVLLIPDEEFFISFSRIV